ncbi:MAG: polyprenyl synthetase family protein [Candidatus Marinimicrobia bacterium]|jgi:octaprenyl-diphosphate synthase|nr:polyprenyl synthetase family protein [Candidatus Neomarinimicrobiota bacterium]|tara:strand:+ start:704 stop:1777 length:1074 start_codon:yes stop_codon:yes gene_type:complete
MKSAFLFLKYSQEKFDYGHWINAPKLTSVMTDSRELKKILAPIWDDLKLFQKEFEDALRSEVRLINIIAKYLIRHKGKGIRPVLTILSARMTGTPTLNSYKAAAMVEFLHVATLMHDDVVDDAKLRRGFPTINRVWKNKASIIMGDFLLSKVLTNLIGLRNFDALDLISVTAGRLSTGEMLQIEKSYRKNMKEKVYYKMIKDKTASLIGTSCELGAITSSGKGNHKEKLRNYGENFGIAFQIKDDLFDILGSSKDTGKDVNSDVSRNMMTLPVIYTLERNITSVERKHIRKTMKNGASKKDIRIMTEIVDSHGGFDYARDQINNYSDCAIDALAEFPDSPYKQSLVDLTAYNANRNR